jgi:hypothetical protein
MSKPIFLPTVNDAYEEAKVFAKAWSSPAVYVARMDVGGPRARWQDRAQTFPKFREAYLRRCVELLSGHDLPDDGCYTKPEPVAGVDSGPVDKSVGQQFLKKFRQELEAEK